MRMKNDIWPYIWGLVLTIVVLLFILDLRHTHETCVNYEYSDSMV